MVFKEIGSNFYSDKIRVESVISDEIIKNNYPHDYSIIYPSTGRNAISCILKELKISSKTALLPAYTCDEVIKPFVEENFQLNFYNFATDMGINRADLAAKISAQPPGILFFHGLYGRNTFMPNKDLIDNARKKGWIIIEDDTQTMFSNVDRLKADFYLGSLRKWLGIPDGAFIAANNSSRVNLSDFRSHEKYINLLIEAFSLKSNYVKTLDEELKKNYKRLYLEAQNIIDNNMSVFSMSDISRGIWNSTDFEELVAARKKNYNHLFCGIKGKFSNVKPVFPDKLEDGVCPFYFPFYVNEREKIQFLLSEEEIFATLIWPKSKYIFGIDDSTHYIYNHILAIPCDQRYKLRDMQRIINVLKKIVT